MIITILIIALIATLAGPKIADAYNATASRTAADSFVHEHELARITAVRFGRIGMLHIDPSTASFYIDVDTSGRGNYQRVGNTQSYASRGVTMSSTATLLCFDIRGLRSSRGSCQSGVQTIVFARAARRDTVQITALGKVIR